MKKLWLTRIGRDRRGVTAIVFAVSALSLTMMGGLLLDFGNYMLLRGNLNLAADAAVLTGVTQAATQLGPNPETYLTLGQQAGLARMNGQSGQASNAHRKPRDFAERIGDQRSGDLVDVLHAVFCRPVRLVGVVDVERVIGKRPSQYAISECLCRPRQFAIDGNRRDQQRYPDSAAADGMLGIGRLLL
jgi:hypothetical protein